ncbi:hypothetical protein GCM10010399_46340 [Dactylosporangium fulvum]|uniref:Glycosyltransferase RgtA/B/C/D-like domain-containing protein n=1 Tax=Dactylosporangium fulvum TaxID=53359 RepID=A0ABY5W0I9_9ACTN|nr:hypothetical protein [Dactylosporangium fulvum]UWP83573.1 hypothetical protein Dfulv_04635 [Dactylosporangium fulvum]
MATATIVPDRVATPLPPRRRSAWAPALTVAVAVAGLLLALGTSPPDVARYSAYLGLGVVLPGMLLYRSLRSRPHSLLEDVAFGTVVGLLAETVALVAFRGLVWIGPLLVIAVFLAVPRLRRHWRMPRYPERPSAVWSWTVAGIALFFLGYLTVAFLAVNVPVPVDGPRQYMIDQLNLLAVAADLKHHFPLAVPEQGDRPLRYHWFAYGHLAAGSLSTGIDLPVLWFRLDLPVLAVLTVGLLAVTGWRVTRRAWAGPVAAALMFVVGEAVPPAQAPAFFGTITAYYSWSSRSILYAAALTMPFIAAAVAVLRREADRRTWLLAVLFAAGTTGAKSTVLPLAGVGVALVCAVHLLRRRPSWTPWLLGGAFAVVEVFAVSVLYGFGGQGLSWGPFTIMLDFVGDQYTGTTPADLPLIVWGLGAYAIAMGARLAGIVFPLRRWGDVELFLAGALAAGVVGSLTVWHVSWGQHFFIIAGWPFGAILSAWGLVLLADRIPDRAGTRVAVAVALPAAVALAVFALVVPVPQVPARWGVPLPTYVFGGVVLLTALAVGAGLALAGRRHAALRGTGAFAALAVVLFAGGARLPHDAATSANLGVRYHVRVTPEQAAGARWLRDHSTPAEYVATNVHRVGSGEQARQSLAYWISAYSERRVLLGSWGYSPESAEMQSARHRLGPSLVYWDPDRLAANDAAIYNSTPERLAWLWSQRVRWIVVDRAQGTESPHLADLADLAWQQGTVAIYRLRPTPPPR